MRNSKKTLVTIGDETKTIQEWADHCNNDPDTRLIMARLREGKEEKDIIISSRQASSKGAYMAWTKKVSCASCGEFNIQRYMTMIHRFKFCPICTENAKQERAIHSGLTQLFNEGSIFRRKIGRRSSFYGALEALLAIKAEKMTIPIGYEF